MRDLRGSRTSRGWRAALATVAFAAVVSIVSGCAPSGVTGPTGSTAAGPSAVPLADVPEIASIWWQQAQSLPEFDHSAHTTTDADDIDDLRQVLAEHGVVEAFRFTHADCEGGLTTWVTYTTTDGDEVDLQTNSCEGASDFEQDLNDLVSGWREG